MSMHYCVRFRSPEFRDEESIIDVHESRVLHIIYHYSNGMKFLENYGNADSQHEHLKMLTKLAAAYLDGLLTRRRNYTDPEPLIDVFVKLGEHETSLPPESMGFADKISRRQIWETDFISTKEGRKYFLEMAAKILTSVLDEELLTSEQIKIIEQRRLAKERKCQS